MGGLAARERRAPARKRARGAPAERGATAPGRRYEVAQRHDAYAPAEHDTWGQLLARTEALVRRHEGRLHPAYVEGFRRLVLPWKRIPRLDRVNAALAPFGWKTLCVNGYLPPEVYSGLLARGVVPNSREIRAREQVEFSPTPDLAHDMLGHIPMLVSAEYRRYLRCISRATAAAPSGPLDRELFLAHRMLGVLHGTPLRRRRALAAVAARVQAAQAALAAAPSRLAQLDRLYLWSVEFGLMGTPDDFRIYGAALLSSPAEAEALCTKGAPLVTFSAAVTQRAIHFSEYQSAYFIARDYAQLHDVLSDVQSSWRDAG